MPSNRPYVKTLSIDHARFVYKSNFEGRPTNVNPRGGIREFNIEIDEGSVESLKSEGWNVKATNVTEQFPNPRYYIPVEVRYPDPRFPDRMPQRFIPHIYLVDGVDTTLSEIFEENVADIDDYQIVDMWADIRPRTYQDEDTGEWRVKAFLQELNIQIEENRYAKRFNRREYQNRNAD